MENKYYIIRADRAGVFFGQIKERNGSEVTMTNVRRLWKWDGATECLQLANDGVLRPRNCKFTIVAPELTVLGVTEIIPCTDKSVKSLSEVAEWRA